MFATIENLRLRAIALRSSIHNEHQLSAIELTAMCAKKTNELIDIINELTEHMQTLESEHKNLKIQYDEVTETLRIGVAENE